MYPLQPEALGLSAMARDPNGHVLVAEAEALVRYVAAPAILAASSRKTWEGSAISLAQTADGAIFAGMRDLGLVQLRGDSRLQLRGLPDQKVNVLLDGEGQDLWIGTDAGLACWDGTSVSQNGIPSALGRSQILALAYDHDKNLWVSTPLGVMRSFHPNGTAASLPPNAATGPVHAIFEDHEGNLWARWHRGPGAASRFAVPRIFRCCRRFPLCGRGRANLGRPYLRRAYLDPRLRATLRSWRT